MRLQCCIEAQSWASFKFFPVFDSCKTESGSSENSICDQWWTGAKNIKGTSCMWRSTRAPKVVMHSWLRVPFSSLHGTLYGTVSHVLHLQGTLEDTLSAFLLDRLPFQHGQCKSYFLYIFVWTATLLHFTVKHWTIKIMNGSIDQWRLPSFFFFTSDDVPISINIVESQEDLRPMCGFHMSHTTL